MNGVIYHEIHLHSLMARNCAISNNLACNNLELAAVKFSTPIIEQFIRTCKFMR